MSDSTTVPGMGNQYQSYNFGNTNPNINGERDSFGKQTIGFGSFGSPMEAGGTVVQAYPQAYHNMQQGASFPNMQQAPGYANMPEQNIIQNGEGQTLYGLLYSVSRIGTGEYWPVFQGENTIGSDPSCNIHLQESSVSPQHLSLVIRKNRNPEKIVAAVRDLGSDQGTMLNGESLGFEATECHNGDMLTIGQNYELLFILIDTFELGLKQAEKFIPIGTLSPQQAYDTPFIPSTPVNLRPGYDFSVPPSFRPNQNQPALPNFNPNQGSYGSYPNGTNGMGSMGGNSGGFSRNNNDNNRRGTQILR